MIRFCGVGRAARHHGTTGTTTVHRPPGRPVLLTLFLRRRLSAASSSLTQFTDENVRAVRVPEAQRTALERTVPMSRMRNFSIIAHIDHGKSTLADRFLEAAGNITAREREHAQVLDSLAVERERGITVKSQTASMLYRCRADGETYLLNLVDTPGHVDFSYEVSRSLSACQGALLLVDSSQGVQAQTLANFQIANSLGVRVIPVLSKIDQTSSDPEAVLSQIEEGCGLPAADSLRCSAKTGEGVLDLLEAVVSRVPPPACRFDAHPDEAAAAAEAIAAGVASGRPVLRALLVDSWYNSHRGVVCLVQVADGELRTGDLIGLHHVGGTYEVQEVGLMEPTPRKLESLRCGQVGYMIANIKTPKEVRLGDTIVLVERLRNAQVLDRTRRQVPALPGFRPAKCFVYAGLFPSVKSDFEGLRSAVDRLLLNDPSVSVTVEHSDALGMGFHCGFLGVLHMDVFIERLEGEFGASVIRTTPTVTYKLVLPGGEEELIETASKFPTTKPAGAKLMEPVVSASIICPQECVGPLVELCNSHRGDQTDVLFLGGRVLLRYTLPLGEIISEFYSSIKSLSSGFASLDYELAGYRECKLQRLDVRINGDLVDPLSFIAPSDRAYDESRRMLDRLLKNVERQNYELRLQVVSGSKVVASEVIKPYRKDVLIKSGKTVGGGDPTRKAKLLEKQKEGKKRLKEHGSVELGPAAFLSILQNKS